MEQTIQIKRNLIDATAVPSSLKGGELAVNAKDRALFVGDGSSVVKLYTGDSKYFDSEGAANKAVAAVDEGFKIGNLYLKYDSTNNAIYVEGGNFYATEEVSAFGYGGIVDDDDSGSGNIDTTYLVTTNTIQTISASKTFTSTVKYNPSFYTYNAEDIEYRTTSGTLFGGIGAVHNGNTVSYFYMGTGTTPWNGSTGLVVGEELGFNGYQVWHSGNIQPITKHQDLSNYVKLTGALKNPYTLTWSGYSSGSYDGSAAASITIPTLDGYVNTITTTGSGNAITAASNSGSTITFTKGTTFLTAHQAIYNLTLQAGAFSAVTFDPNGAAATVNIPTTTSHISEGSNLYFTNARAVSALSSTLSGYLPLTGGTLTSSALVPLTIKSTYTSGYSAMRFISSTSGAYFAMNKSGNFIVTDSAWSAEYSILHSGNYNSYTYSQSTIDSKLSGYQPLSTAINTGNIGSQSVSHATTTKRFSFLAYSGDLNTVLAGGGLGRDYSYGLSSCSTFTNGPSGASYGSVLQLSAASAV